jgi:hypothetical protein
MAALSLLIFHLARPPLRLLITRVHHRAGQFLPGLHLQPSISSVQVVAVSHKAPELEPVAAAVLREAQSVLHQVRPLKLLLARQAVELFQRTQVDVHTRHAHMVVAVKVALAISFVQE